RWRRWRWRRWRWRRWRWRWRSPEAVRAGVTAASIAGGIPDERSHQAGLRRIARALAATTGRLRVFVGVDPDDERGGREPLADRRLHVRLHLREVVAEGHQIELLDVG